MPEALTSGDSFLGYLTGASSHGGSQSDPDLSLGKRTSSSGLHQITVTSSDIVTLGSGQVTIAAIGGANGPGTGTITVVDANTLNWTPPGGSAGSNVAIASGETKVLNGGGTGGASKWIKLFRSDPGAMSGSGAVTIARFAANAVAGDRASSSELTAGASQYRCISVKCQNAGGADSVKLRSRTQGTSQVSNSAQLGASGAGTITTSGSFADWPAQGFVAIYTNAGVFKEAVYYSTRSGTSLTVPAAGREMFGSTAAAGAATDRVYCLQGNIALGLDPAAIGSSPTYVDNTGAGEGTAPSGVTFSIAVYDPDNSVDDRIDVGDMDDGEYFGVWTWREIPVNVMSGDPAIGVDFGVTADVA